MATQPTGPTLLEVLRARALEHPDRRAYTFLADGETASTSWTYRELDARCRALGHLLQRLGGRGERALLLFPPGLDFAAGFFGAVYGGAVAVPVPPPRASRGLGRLRRTVEDARPAIALTTSSLLAKLGGQLARDPVLGSLRCVPIDELPDGLAEEWQDPGNRPEETAFLQYTSGSTAAPKGVMVSHGNLLHNLGLIAAACGHSAGSTFVSWLPLYHDLGLIGNLLQSAYVGAHCVLMPPVTFLQQPRRWLQAVSRFRATTSGGPNFAYDLCARKVPPDSLAGLDLSTWEVAFNGAEPVRHDTLARFAAAFAPAGFRRDAFYPCYGLAEATLMVSGGRPLSPVCVQAFARGDLERGRAAPASATDDVPARTLVGCGPVLGEQRLEIVDAATGRPVPAGEIGEIWLAGPSVGQGYWGRPEETARTFAARLEGSGDGPFLRTGDLGFRFGGEVFIAGRLKDLIIVRGRNHHPQDVELTAERSCPALRSGAAAAFAVEDDGEERLVVVAEVDRRHGDDLEAAAGAIRQAVANEHELHVSEVVLLRAGTIPKTTSGKIQRAACRAQHLAGELAVVFRSRSADDAAWRWTGWDRDSLLALPAPERRAALLARLVERVAWAAKVPPRRIDAGLPLAALGLDSLAMVELRDELEAELEVRLAAAALLEAPSLAELAAAVLAAVAADGPAVPWVPLALPAEPAAETVEHPLSYVQQSFWFLQEREPQSAAYNVAVAARLDPEVAVAILRGALEQLAARHSSLRTTFGVRDGEPVQRVAVEARIDFREIDAGDWSDGELERRLAAEAHRPFDLAAGPVWRGVCCHRGAAGPVLLLAAHHLVVDGWSVWLLLDELAALYAAARRGEPMPPVPLAPPAYAYTDFVRWQAELLAGPRGEELRRFWLQELAGELSPLELPVDRSRAASLAPPCGTAAFGVGPELTRRLRQLARAHGTTLYAVLLAAFQALLHRYTGQRELVVASAVAGRGRAEWAGVVGCFFNPLPLRADFTADPSFAELLAQARRRTAAALAHQDYPAHLLAEQLPAERGGPSLFDVTFLFQRPQRLSGAAGEGAGLAVAGDGLARELFGVERRFARSTLELEVVDRGDALGVALHYRSDLFEGATVERMAACFEVLLGTAAAGPQRAVSELGLLPAAEEHRLLASWSVAERRYPLTGTIRERIEARAAARPASPATVGDGRTLSYGDLDREAERLARGLVELAGGSAAGGAGDRLIGLMVEHGHGLPLGLLAIWKAGCGFVPIDPAWPRERIALLAAECRLTVLVTEGRFLDKALELAVPGGPLRHLVCLDAVPAGFAPGPGIGLRRCEDEARAALPARDADPDEIAYVIYTSGSTGRPKGVAVTHRNLIPVLLWGCDALRLGEGSRVLQTLSYWFDFGVFEVLTTLLAGGTLVLQDPAQRGEPRHYAEQARREGVNTVHTTPAFFRELAALGERLPGLAVLHFGGEELTPALVAAVRPLVGAGCAIFNGYGPTEAAVNSSLFEVGRDGESRAASFPIGRPSANNRLYVLDRWLRPVPAGALGQLYVGGDGLARGYLARPALTADRFLPDPFAGEPGARLYRTGDLVRFRADGNVEFRGRIDDQVKVRGYRVEPGEVEQALALHPAVLQSAVVVRDDLPSGGRGLVAYVVPAGTPAAARELRAFLRDRLPAPMIPAAFVNLAGLPRNSNGKLDRSALPSPPSPQAAAEPAAEKGCVPRGPVEEVVAGLCAQMLGRPSVEVDEDLFELGCHSLLATRIVVRLREIFQVELPLATFFESPSVSGLAAAIQQAGGAALAGLPPVSRAPRDRPLPLSFAQERLWFLHQLDPRSAAYNTLRALRVEGPLQPHLVARAYSEICRRHEILRTTFPAVDGVPVQIVHPPWPVAVPVVDLTALPAGQRERCVDGLVVEQGQRPFDLESGPLVRLALLRTGAAEHVLVFCEHHIVHDGWTIGVLVGEFLRLYRALAAGGRSPLPELPIQYGDFAYWQRRYLEGEALAPLQAYWQAQLADVPRVLELPFDRPRRAAQSFRGAARNAVLAPALAAAARGLGRRQGATFFMCTLAAFAALLHRLSGQERFAIGIPIANRRRPELEGLLGMLVNTLALRAELTGGPTFSELLRRTREICLGAYAHQDLPFEKLVEALRPERTLRHMPLFQVMHTFLDMPLDELELPNLTLTVMGSHNRTAKLDLHLTVSTRAERPGAPAAASLELEYSTDLFDAATAERILGQFQTLLAGAAAEPDMAVGRLPLLSAPERQQLAREWNDTAAAYPAERAVHQLFAAAARRRPDAAAVVCGEEVVSYRELDRWSDRLARRLRRLGAGPESVVAFALTRSPAMVAAILGILKAGAAYAPLDPAYPAERLRLMLEDLGASLLLTEEGLAGSLPPSTARVMLLARDTAGDDGEGEPWLDPWLGPDALAYVMFTSGSTGRPKGVAVTHRGVVRLVRGGEYARLGPDEVFLQLVPVSFDVSTLEIWGALLNASTVVLPASRMDAMSALGEWISRHGVTMLWLTTGVFDQVAEHELESLRPLRQLLAGGDALSPRHVERVRQRYPGLRLVNGYGPTENTTFSSCCRLDGAAWPCASVPIGRPIANSRALVLDDGLEPAAVGVTGELLVGGDGLARCYLGRPELTAARFVPDPLSEEPGQRLYRTGDLARWLPDGRLEFLGRRDGQVKVRGFRVELAEVEAALARCPGVCEAVVTLAGEQAGEKRLVAYVTAQDGVPPAAAELRRRLAASLPDYMVPGAYVTVDRMPLTANGKVDRRALPAPDRPASVESFVAPRSEVERLLAGIWGELLEIDAVGVHDDFFRLGGHSLHVTRLLSRVRREIDVDVPVSEFFKKPTVAGLALAVAASLAADLDGDDLFRLVAEVDRGESGSPLLS